jgi:hypothetical protein
VCFREEWDVVVVVDDVRVESQDTTLVERATARDVPTKIRGNGPVVIAVGLGYLSNYGRL